MTYKDNKNELPHAKTIIRIVQEINNQMLICAVLSETSITKIGFRRHDWVMI